MATIHYDRWVKDGVLYVKAVDVDVLCEHYLDRVKESNKTAALWREKCEATEKLLAKHDSFDDVVWKSVAESVSKGE